MIADHVQGHHPLGHLARHLNLHAAHHGRVSLANSCFEVGFTCRVISVRVGDLIMETACSRSFMQQGHYKANAMCF